MSGFSYPEWIGNVYPKGTRRNAMLTAYSQIFNAVEINMSFRRTPEESTIDRWRDAVAETFRFTMKANQVITHYKRLVDVAQDVSDFLERARRLGERLGPVLFQVPPNMKFDTAVMDAFSASLPPGSTYAFEPRDASFLTDEAGELLRKRGLTLCLNDDLFDPSAYRLTGPVGYFRFHRDFYDADAIAERASLVRSIANDGKDVYVFFAHEDNPQSVKPALAMKEALGGATTDPSGMS